MYLTSKLKIRSEEESDKSALILRKCPVRPLYTVYDLIKKVLNVEDVPLDKNITLDIISIKQPNTGLH